MFLGHRGFDHVRWRGRETGTSCIADDNGAERGPFCVRGDEGSRFVGHCYELACVAWGLILRRSKPIWIGSLVWSGYCSQEVKREDSMECIYVGGEPT